MNGTDFLRQSTDSVQAQKESLAPTSSLVALRTYLLIVLLIEHTRPPDARAVVAKSPS